MFTAVISALLLSSTGVAAASEYADAIDHTPGSASGKAWPKFDLGMKPTNFAPAFIDRRAAYWMAGGRRWIAPPADSNSTASRPMAAATPAAYQETAQPGDPVSWRTDEFNADWGLGAIGAEYAYARGLSGKGVRLGLFDSGAGLQHSEFAGKNHHGIQIGDLLPDGTRCANTSIVSGPGACFSSKGDAVQIEYVYFDPSVPQRIRDIILNGPYLQPGFTYQSHGTHVAGTMAANRDGSGMHGVSFGADLTSSKLFFDSVRKWTRTATGYGVVSVGGVGPEDSAIDDLFAQMNAEGVRAINHSWGFTSEPDTEELLDLYLTDPSMQSYWQTFRKGSLDKGMIQVWAAGNTNSVVPSPEESPIAGVHATLPRGFSELEPYWLSVVNVGQTDTGGYVLSNRSNQCGFSMNWCLAAPGSLITSSVYGGDANLTGGVTTNADGSISLTITGQSPTFEYADYSGTSMAAPHVTGALGLLFERFPYLNSAQVRDVLLTTATDLGAPGVDEIYGWGLLDLRKAIEGPGLLRVDTDVVMNQRAGGLKVWQGDAWDDWTNAIGGPGRLTKSGAGWLRLSGDNSFAGVSVKQGVLELTGNNSLSSDVRVEGGLLDIAGNLNGTALTVSGGIARINGSVSGAPTTIQAAGRLHGTGTLSDTSVAGTIAPGNSIGTLTINGNYVQQAGSFYEVELQAPASSDLIAVSGTATLQGGTVRAFRTPGTYLLGQSYRILNAQSGVSGIFAGLDITALASPFLKMDLVYGANSVDLNVLRGESLASVAATPNQRATATAIDALPLDSAVLQSLVLLNPVAAMSAVDQLSGEAHASTQSALIDSSRHLRDAALARGRNGQDAFTSQVDDGRRFGVWVEASGNGGSLDSDGNAAQVRYDGQHTLVGADYQFASGWRLGVLGGTGKNSADLQGRRSRAEVDSTLAGVYVGQAWGGFGLRGGATWAKHDIEVQRTIAYPGFSDATYAQYDGETRQVFVEGGYRFGDAARGVEPYLQYARVDSQADGFREQGGGAALSGQAEDTSVDVATLGVRFDLGLKGAQQEQTWLNLRGGIGYRQANGDTTPSARLNFAGATTAFTVHGAPIADNATVAELGLGARLSQNSLLELGYSGQFADGADDHGVNARFSVRF